MINRSLKGLRFFICSILYNKCVNNLSIITKLNIFQKIN